LQKRLITRIAVIAACTVTVAGATVYLGFKSVDSPLIPITTDSDLARGHFLRGRDLAERLRVTEAFDLFERAVREDPHFALAYLHLSRVHPSPKASLDMLIRAVELSGRVSEGERLLILASQAYSTRKPAEERELLQRLVNTYPDDPRAHNEFGNSLFWQHSWAAAAAQYEAAIELDSAFSQPYNGLGYCFRFLGDLASAEQCFLKYMQLIPDDPNPYDSYADLLTEMNRPEEAIAFSRKAQEINPEFMRATLGIALNFNILGRHTKARNELTRMFESAHDDGQRRAALMGMAISYADEGDVESAAARLRTASELAEAAGDQTALAADLDWLGLVLLEAGRADEASGAFTRSLQVLEQSGIIRAVVENAQIDHVQRTALVWLARRDYETAREFAEEFRVLTRRLDDPARIRLAHQTLGLIALVSGDAQKATQELAQADLSQAYTQYHLALAYELTGDLPRALRYYRQASTYDQFNPLTQAFVRDRARAKVESLLLADGG